MASAMQQETAALAFGEEDFSDFELLFVLEEPQQPEPEEGVPPQQEQQRKKMRSAAAKRRREGTNYRVYGFASA